MGMSASQVRLLSLTSRMHDLEFQAQGVQYSKLDLADDENEAYEKYLDAMDASKLQMTVVTANGNEFKDVTYTNLVSRSAGVLQSMYAVTNAEGNILLPEQITSKIDVNTLDSLDSFLEIVGKNYLYSARADLTTTDEIFAEMKNDGNYDYWKSIYYQIIGYQNDNGEFVNSRGYDTIYAEKTTDRDWLMNGINNAELFLCKMTTKSDTLNGSSINIFAKTGVAEDPDITETYSEELVNEARTEYEHRVKELDIKDSKLDLTLSQIDTQHNALKTEYDSVKQIVSKSIERSYKTFNA